MSKLRNKWNETPLSVKAATAYTISNILLKGLSFITMPLFTSLLTKEQYGQYTVYQSWSGIMTILLTLNLAYGSFSRAMIRFEDRRDRYISSVQGICTTLTFVFILIYLPFMGFFNQLFEMPTWLVLVMVTEILAHNSVLLWTGKKRFEYKYKSVVALTLFISLISPLLAFLLVISSTEKGYMRIIGYAAPTIAVGSFLYILNQFRGKAFFSKEFWKYALGFNLPLLLYYLSQTIFNQSDRIMISHIEGTDKAALYGVAYNLAMLMTLVLNSLNNSYVPWFYGKLRDGKQKENVKVSTLIALIMSLSIIFVVWFAPEIITIMTAASGYEEAIAVVPPVAASLLLLYYSQLFINVEFYYERKFALAVSSVFAAVLNIVLNAILIPVYGFVAAGYTTLFSYLVFAGANYISMRRILKQNYVKNDFYDYKMLILILLVFFGASALGMALYAHLIPRIIVTLVVLSVMIVFRKQLFGVLKGLII